MGNINKTVKSKYPPKQKNVNWIDTSGNKPIIKVFNNGKWLKLSGGGANVKIPIPTAEDEGKILVVTETEGNTFTIVPEQPVPADNETPLTDVDLTKFVVGNTVKFTITPEENGDGNDDTPVPGHLPDYSGPVEDSGPVTESEQGGSSGTLIPGTHKPVILEPTTSQTLTLTGVIEEHEEMVGVRFNINDIIFGVWQINNLLYTSAIDVFGPATIKLEYIESNYEYQLQENSGGNNSIVSVDINNMPNTLSPNIIYDFGELDQDIEFPEFESTDGYGTYTILFETADDIEIGFNSEVIWEGDSPDGTSGKHIEIHIHSIGDNYYGYYTEWELPVDAHYLTFTAVEDNSSVGFMYWVGPGPGTCPDLGKNMEYSLDNGKTWETYTIVNDYNNINYINLEHVGDSVMFRGNNETLKGEGGMTKCEIQGKVSASGDITSLLNGIGGDIPIPGSCFAMFFFYEDGLTSAPNLPSTQLGSSCYGNMFNNCTSLTKAPVLPATQLANSCYSQMFYECTSLVNVPVLPATTLAEYCYSSMFYGCTSLIVAPELPATNIASYGGHGGCYNFMFKNCTQLNSVKVALSSIPWDDDNFRFPYTEEWLSGVAATGTFKWNGSVPYNGTRNASLIPSGWTVESL